MFFFHFREVVTTVFIIQNIYNSTTKELMIPTGYSRNIVDLCVFVRVYVGVCVRVCTCVRACVFADITFFVSSAPTHRRTENTFLSARLDCVCNPRHCQLFSRVYLQKQEFLFSLDRTRLSQTCLLSQKKTVVHSLKL